MVCSGARGRGLDDANFQAPVTRKGDVAGGETEGDRMSWREGEGEADMQATEERGNTPTFVT